MQASTKSRPNLSPAAGTASQFELGPAPRVGLLTDAGTVGGKTSPPDRAQKRDNQDHMDCFLIFHINIRVLHNRFWAFPWGPRRRVWGAPGGLQEAFPPILVPVSARGHEL